MFYGKLFLHLILFTVLISQIWAQLDIPGMKHYFNRHQIRNKKLPSQADAKSNGLLTNYIVPPKTRLGTQDYTLDQRPFVISPSTRELIHPITIHSAAQSPHSVKTETGNGLSFVFPTTKSKPVVTYGKPIKGIIKPIASQPKPIQYSGTEIQTQGFLGKTIDPLPKTGKSEKKFMSYFGQHRPNKTSTSPDSNSFVKVSTLPDVSRKPGIAGSVYPTNGRSKPIPGGDIINIKVGVGGQVASKVRLDSVAQKFIFPSTDQGYTDHVIPPAVTNTRRPLNNKEVTPHSPTPGPTIPLLKFPPTNTIDQRGNEFYDDIGLVSSFSYFRTPQLTKDLDNYISNHASEKIASQFLRYMSDQSGFPGHATVRESPSLNSVDKKKARSAKEDQAIVELTTNLLKGISL